MPQHCSPLVVTKWTQALSNQKLLEMRARFGHSRCGLQTGDTSLNTDADIVIMTTEILRNIMYRTAEVEDAAKVGAAAAAAAATTAARISPDQQTERIRETALPCICAVLHMAAALRTPRLVTHGRSLLGCSSISGDEAALLPGTGAAVGACADGCDACTSAGHRRVTLRTTDGAAGFWPQCGSAPYVFEWILCSCGCFYRRLTPRKATTGCKAALRWALACTHSCSCKKCTRRRDHGARACAPFSLNNACLPSALPHPRVPALLLWCWRSLACAAYAA